MENAGMTKAKISPKDLIPQATELEISGQDPVQIRPVNIQDWSWMQTKFGEDIQKTLLALPVDHLMIILYRLMDDDGKARFRPKTEKTYDDDGEEIEKRFTGPEMLGKKIIGMNGLQAAVQCFQLALGVSDKLAQELAIDHKGNIEPISKKKKVRKQTGRKSMTS